MTPVLALIGHQARLDCDFGREVMISLVLVDHARGATLTEIDWSLTMS